MVKTRGKAKRANGEGGITYREDGRYLVGTPSRLLQGQRGG